MNYRDFIIDYVNNETNSHHTNMDDLKDEDPQTIADATHLAIVDWTIRKEELEAEFDGLDSDHSLYEQATKAGPMSEYARQKMTIANALLRVNQENRKNRNDAHYAQLEADRQAAFKVDHPTIKLRYPVK